MAAISLTSPAPMPLNMYSGSRTAIASSAASPLDFSPSTPAKALFSKIPKPSAGNVNIFGIRLLRRSVTAAIARTVTRIRLRTSSDIVCTVLPINRQNARATLTGNAGVHNAGEAQALAVEGAGLGVGLAADVAEGIRQRARQERTTPDNRE